MNKEILKRTQSEMMLVTNFENKRYLSGFTGTESSVLLTKDKTYLITDGRYNLQANEEAKENVKVIIAKSPRHYLDEIKLIVASSNDSSLAIEGLTMTVLELEKYKNSFPSVKFIVSENIIEDMRLIKNDQEMSFINKALEITEATFEYLLKTVKVGMSEIEVKQLIENKQLELSGEKQAFDCIVASGVNTSFPHATPSNKKIEDGDIVTVDFGCFYKGYCSDMTRTFFIGKKINPELIKIYNCVQTAMKAQIKAINNGIKCSDVDKIGRDIITENGYGDYFVHGTGHGIGLAVHEGPVVNQTSTSVLEAGMVITIEPGIYVPNLGGVRIENDILVTKDGYKVLNKTSTDINIIK